jgi:hypothetical protein
MEKRTVISLVTLGLVLVLGFVLVLKPRMDMDELAQETCDELDGAIVMVAGPIVSKAVGKSERLGFTGPELGDRMREKCPGIMNHLDSL